MEYKFFPGLELLPLNVPFVRMVTVVASSKDQKMKTRQDRESFVRELGIVTLVSFMIALSRVIPGLESRASS